ncbi:hypothetical protein E2C01_012051 [Portunus trituberculatus]|uniref:CLIP domain-containing serine protease n=1 Tax=Portunus trituberculatus TaxID=210409 RepID=A0A5B7DCW9_PORTR|nr:hypothetical protein [Portunus trituberculatus]
MLIVEISRQYVTRRTVNIKNQCDFINRAFSSRCPVGEDCTPLTRCQPLRTLVTYRVPGWERRVRAAHCGGTPGNYRRLNKAFNIPIIIAVPKVCCPREGSPTNTTSRPGVGGENLLPSGHQCGQSHLLKIVFGEDVLLSGYPWMALLGYGGKEGGEGGGGGGGGSG